jgi:hypothetical protein
MNSFDKILLSMIGILALFLLINLSLLGNKVENTTMPQFIAQQVVPSSNSISSYNSYNSQKNNISEQSPISNILESNPPSNSYYPAFIVTLMHTIQSGRISSFIYMGDSMYAVLPSFAPGTGLTIYNSIGNTIASCPISPNRPAICDSLSNGTIIWQQY